MMIEDKLSIRALEAHKQGSRQMATKFLLMWGLDGKTICNPVPLCVKDVAIKKHSYDSLRTTRAATIGI